MEKICENCKWYEPYAGACCNGDSMKCADFCDTDNTCEEFESV